MGWRPIIGWTGCTLALILSAPASAAAAPAVTNNQDNGAGSLRAAIAASNPGDTITIPAAVGPITLSSGVISLNHSLTINGAGQSTTTISGGDTQQIFDVTGASSQLTVSNLTLTHGKADYGSAIRTDGPLTLTNVTVSHNLADNGGAGVITCLGATLAVSGSTFDSNTSTFAGFGGQGAAITFNPFASADGTNFTMTVDRSTFTNNTSTGGTSNDDEGGAILFQPSLNTHSHGTASLTVTGSTFTGNLAGDAGGSHGGGDGGAIAFDGADVGAATQNKFSLTLSSDKFNGNQALGGTIAGFGGAVLFRPVLSGSSDSDSIAISGTTFSGNSAGADAPSSAGGGALELTPDNEGSADGTTATIAGSTFTNNTAGAASAAAVGGGAVVFRPFGVGTASTSLAVSSTSFSSNKAGVGATGLVSGGGALDFGPAVNSGATTTLSVTRSSFTANATGSQGSVGRGGGLSFAPGVTTAGAGTEVLTLDQDSFDQNTAGGGGVPPVAPFGSGGGVNVIPGAAATATIAVTNSTFSNNSAGGKNPLAGAAGGGINLAAGALHGTTLLRNDTFTANQAGVGATAPTVGLGGGINVDPTETRQVTLDNDTVTGNAVGGTAQGAGVDGPASVVYENSIVSGNAGADCAKPASHSGGGNVEGGTSCGFTGTHDRQHASPKLGPLKNNGSPSGVVLQTMLPLPGSPALGNGLATDCPTTDERGVARPVNAPCDAGAVQIRRASISTGAARSITGTTATIAFTVHPGESPITSVRIQYGKTKSYGHSATVSGGKSSVKLKGLKPSSTYHYRALVTDGYGTSAGVDRTLKTKGARPVNKKRPKITGTPTVGAKLICSKGAWINKPTRFAYAWKRNGKTVGRKRSYRVQSSDLGNKLSCSVTASNAGGKSKPAKSRSVLVR